MSSSATDPTAVARGGRLVQERLARGAQRVSPEHVKGVRAFARAYVRRISAEVVQELSAEELFAQVAGAFEFADRRAGDSIAVRAFNPTLASDGYSTVGSVVETNCDDSPFLLDSVRS